ncbi:MAG: hypothetical protein ACYDA0_11550 [Candidatus Dormibacteraceae bacterium]
MSTEGGMNNLRRRSKELASGAGPWRFMARLYWRWWVAIGVYLALLAILDFGFGWDYYRAVPWAYFPAMAVLIVSFSSPRRLRARAAAGRGSVRSFVAAWGLYLVALAAFAALFLTFGTGLSWTVSKSVLVAAYLSAGLLGVGLSAQSMNRR